jgi:hypothetical protein
MEAFALTEKQFLQQVKDLARILGWRTYHTWQSIHSQKGYPDLTMWRVPRDDEPGRVLLAELKSAKGKVSPEQLQTISELRVCGLDVHIWRPDDLDLIVEVLGGNATSGAAHNQHG